MIVWVFRFEEYGQRACFRSIVALVQGLLDPYRWESKWLHQAQRRWLELRVRSSVRSELRLICAVDLGRFGSALAVHARGL